MKSSKHVLSLALTVCAASAYGQGAPLTELPPDLAQIRALQERLEVEQDVGIRYLDEVSRSTSNLNGVPLEFREERIETEHDMLALLDRLYVYFGFSGSESLELESAYPGFDPGSMQFNFREYIAGIPTSQIFTIHTDSEMKLSHFPGWLYLDRDLPREPAMSRQDAIDTVLCFLEYHGWLGTSYVADGPHDVERVYETWGRDLALIPVWRVTPARKDPRSSGEAFAVMPGHVVQRSATFSHGDSTDPYSCADPGAIPNGQE